MMEKSQIPHPEDPVPISAVMETVKFLLLQLSRDDDDDVCITRDDIDKFSVSTVVTCVCETSKHYDEVKNGTCMYYVNVCHCE